MNNYDCVLCNESREEALHHFWDCTFAQDCWDSILPAKPGGISSYEGIILAKQALSQKIAKDIIIRLLEPK